MKKSGYYFITLIVFIIIQSFCLVLTGQLQRQIVGTSDGKYGIVTVNKISQDENTVTMNLSVEWVDEDFKPVEDNESVIVLDKDKLHINQSNFLNCENFKDKDYVCFNKSIDMLFKINDAIKEEGLNFTLPFTYAENSSSVINVNNRRDFMMMRPKNLTVDYSINRDLFVKKVSTPPTIEFISPVIQEGVETVSQESEIELSIKATDENGINLVTVNSEDAAAHPDDIFKSKIKLNAGNNVINVMAIDNDGSIIEENITIYCNDYSMAADMLLKGGKYYGLFIAIEDYDDPRINDLDNAVEDAKLVYDVLLDYYSFEKSNMKMLINPKREDIVIQLDKLSRTITGKDNLLIFYAGHGHWEEKSSIGYWLPSDAKRSNTANWFRNSTLRDYISSINSGHTLLIADACFTGSIFKTRSAFANTSVAVEKLYKLPSRKAMTSGTLEEVPDKSVFVEYLVKRLRDNEEIFLSSETLFSSFRAAVMNNSPNLPQFGEINNTGDEGGDFIFIRKKGNRK
jgi:hypothetical protein